MRSQPPRGLLFNARYQLVFLLTVVAMNALQAFTPNKRPQSTTPKTSHPSDPCAGSGFQTDSFEQIFHYR
jgi:hypothetical protein